MLQAFCRSARRQDLEIWRLQQKLHQRPHDVSPDRDLMSQYILRPQQRATRDESRPPTMWVTRAPNYTLRRRSDGWEPRRCRRRGLASCLVCPPRKGDRGLNSRLPTANGPGKVPFTLHELPPASEFMTSRPVRRPWPVHLALSKQSLYPSSPLCPCQGLLDSDLSHGSQQRQRRHATRIRNGPDPGSEQYIGLLILDTLLLAFNLAAPFFAPTWPSSRLSSFSLSLPLSLRFAPALGADFLPARQPQPPAGSATKSTPPPHRVFRAVPRQPLSRPSPQDAARRIIKAGPLPGIPIQPRDLIFLLAERLELCLDSGFRREPDVALRMTAIWTRFDRRDHELAGPRPQLPRDTGGEFAAAGPTAGETCRAPRPTGTTSAPLPRRADQRRPRRQRLRSASARPRSTIRSRSALCPTRRRGSTETDPARNPRRRPGRMRRKAAPVVLEMKSRAAPTSGGPETRVSEKRVMRAAMGPHCRRRRPRRFHWRGPGRAAFQRRNRLRIDSAPRHPRPDAACRTSLLRHQPDRDRLLQPVTETRTRRQPRRPPRRPDPGRAVVT